LRSPLLRQWAAFDEVECRSHGTEFLCALRCIASRRAKHGSPGAAAREPAAQGKVIIQALYGTSPVLSRRFAPLKQNAQATPTSQNGLVGDPGQVVP
jgi:hypothetical protein